MGHWRIDKMDIETRGGRLRVGGMQPFIRCPVQEKRSARLYAKLGAGFDCGDLTIGFPYLDCRALPIAAHVTIMCRFDQFAALAVCGRATQLDVFGMGPQQRYGGTGFPAENKVSLGQVRRIPDLLGNETDASRKILERSHIRLGILAGSKLVVPALSR